MIGLRADMRMHCRSRKCSRISAPFCHGGWHACLQAAGDHADHAKLGAAIHPLEKPQLRRHRCFLIFQLGSKNRKGAAVMIEDDPRGIRSVSADGRRPVYGLPTGPAFRSGNGGDARPVMAGTALPSRSAMRPRHAAAMPHLGIDTIVTASQLVQAPQTVVSRNLHPCESAVVSVTQFHSGIAWNIIPKKRFCAAPSAASSRKCSRPSSAPLSACSGLGQRGRRSVSCSITATRRQNSAAETDICRQVAGEALGDSRCARMSCHRTGASPTFPRMQGKTRLLCGRLGS